MATRQWRLHGGLLNSKPLIFFLGTIFGMLMFQNIVFIHPWFGWPSHQSEKRVLAQLSDVTTLTSSSPQQQQQQEPVRFRIALMFVGGVRTMVQPGVLQAHVMNVRDALASYGADTVDTFLHLNWNTPDSQTSSQNIPFGSPVRDATADDLRLFQNALEPVQLHLFNDSTCTGLPQTVHREPCCRYKGFYSKRAHSVFLQMAFTRQSFRMVQQYEAEHNIQYDWYVRMRPDVTCFEPMFMPRSLSTKRYYLIAKELEPGTNLNDYIMVVPRNLAEQFFVDQLTTSLNARCAKKYRLFPPEAFLFNDEPRLPRQVLPFPCVHVMENFKAECFRFASSYNYEGGMFAKGETYKQACKRLVREGYFGPGLGKNLTDITVL